MPVTDGKMTAPLGVKAVANFFGVAADVATVCKASMINKWAKHKPTGISPNSPAKPASPHDTSGGYWWAVKLESVVPTNIHNHSFDYKSPTDSGFKRLEEFVGYDHSATPNLDVECSMTPRSASGEGDTLNPELSYSDFATFPIPSANQFGVDYITVFAELLGIDSTDPKVVFKNVYPVCIFDDWMCVMPYYPIIRPEESRTKPLSDGSAWYRFFILDLESLNGAIPGGITDGRHSVTLGVALKLSGESITGIDFSGEWQEVRNTWSDRIFPLPSFTGKVFNVKTPIVAPPAALILNNAEHSVRALWYSAMFPTSTEDIPLQVRVSIICNYGSSSFTATYDANPKDTVIQIKEANWADFGITPAAGTRYTFTGTARTSVDGTHWISGTGVTLTFLYYENV